MSHQSSVPRTAAALRTILTATAVTCAPLAYLIIETAGYKKP